MINIFKLLSTFREPASLINLSNVDILFREKISGTLGIKAGAVGSGNKHDNHCAMLPPPSLRSLSNAVEASNGRVDKSRGTNFIIFLASHPPKQKTGSREKMFQKSRCSLLTPQLPEQPSIFSGIRRNVIETISPEKKDNDRDQKDSYGVINSWL